MGARVEGSTLFDEAQVGEGTVARNLIVGLGTIIHGGCIVRGLFVLGAGARYRGGELTGSGYSSLSSSPI